MLIYSVFLNVVLTSLTIIYTISNNKKSLYNINYLNAILNTFSLYVRRAYVGTNNYFYYNFEALVLLNQGTLKTLNINNIHITL